MSCIFLTIKTRPIGKEVSPSDQEYQPLCSLKMESGEQRSIIHQIMVKKEIEHYITDTVLLQPPVIGQNAPIIMT